MGFNHNKLTEDVIRTLPESVGIIFGDNLTKGISVVSLMATGFNKLIEMRKEWWDKYITGLDAIELIDEHFKSPEYIHFIRQVLLTVAYESRQTKRDYLLNLAINYHKRYTEFVFDKKLMFLNILEDLSESELIYLLY